MGLLAGRDVDLDAVVIEAMGRFEVPGLALGIADGHDELIKGYGVTNAEHSMPVDGDTLFQIGSTSKTFTATATMRLVEEGVLDLDLPVRTYLPQLRMSTPELTEGVTLRHLLTHTSGIYGDWFLLNGVDFGRDRPLEKLEAAMSEVPQLTPLGRVFSYANNGIHLAGRVLEVVAGQPFPDAVQRLVLEPLGLERSIYHCDEMITHRTAAGHVGRGDTQRVFRPWHRPPYMWPSGGIAASARDQMAWARFSMGEGRAGAGAPIVSPQTMAAMQSPQAPTSSAGGHIGITWLLDDVDGVRIVKHGGATNGFQSAFWMVPGRQFAVAVLTNSSPGGGSAHDAISRWVRAELLGLSELDLTPAATSLTPADLLEYEGDYGVGLPTPVYSVTAAPEGQLSLQPRIVPEGGPERPALTMSFVGPDLVASVDTPAIRGEFGRDDTGAVRWLRIGHRVSIRDARGASSASL